MDKPVAKLVGENGNIFNLIAISRRVLKDAGMEEQAKDMIYRISNTAKSYDEALQIIMEYVEVE